MAALLRYENIAALEYHQLCECELNERIATADASDAARLEAQREELRRAGLWRPTIPGPREGYVMISKSKAPPRERRGFGGGGTVDPLKASKKASGGKPSAGKKKS